MGKNGNLATTRPSKLEKVEKHVMTCNRVVNNRSIVYVRVLAHRYNLLGNLHINIRVLRETIYPHHIPAVFEIRGVEGVTPLITAQVPGICAFQGDSGWVP